MSVQYTQLEAVLIGNARIKPEICPIVSFERTHTGAFGAFGTMGMDSPVLQLLYFIG